MEYTMENSMDNLVNEMIKDDKIKESLNNFKISCPVKKINLNYKMQNYMAGMWALTYINESKEYIKENADLENVNDDTILFFTNQHILELAGFIYGIHYLFISTNLLKAEDSLQCIRKIMNMCNSCPTYKMLKDLIKECTTLYFNKAAMNASDPRIIDHYYFIMDNVWFLSYSNLDDMTKTVIKEYNKASENKSESNNEPKE